MSKFTTGIVNTSFKSLVFGCIIKVIIASILAMIIQVSLTVIATGVYTKEVGYQILHSEDEKSYTEVYKYYFEDGKDEKLAQYQDKEHYYKVSLRTTLSDSTMGIINWISVALGIGVLFASVYNSMWRAGDALANKEEFGKQKQDKLFGLKVGLVAEIPFAATYIAMIVGKLFGFLNITGSIFKVANYFFFTYINIFLTKSGNNLTASWSNIAALFAVLLILPLFCEICYKLGHRRLIVKEKIMYKN